jgi:hypothetical protein
MSINNLRFQGHAWISTLNVGSNGGWKLLVNADLSVRPDTGRINSSPRAEITPIVRLQYGCNHTITIPGKNNRHKVSLFINNMPKQSRFQNKRYFMSTTYFFKCLNILSLT